MPTTTVPRPALSFGFKLTLAMVLVVAGVCVTALLALRAQVEHGYREFARAGVEAQVGQFFDHQQARLAAARAEVRAVAGTRNIRLLAALAAGDVARVYSDLDFQLGPIFARHAAGGADGAFFRVFNDADQMLPPPDAPDAVEAALGAQLAPFARAALAAPGATGGADGFGYLVNSALGPDRIYEVMAVPITDPVDGAAAGCLVLGAPARAGRELGRGAGGLHGALLVDGRALSDAPLFTPALVAALEQMLAQGSGRDGARLTAGGEEYLVFFRAQTAAAVGPPAWLATLYSLGELRALNERMTWTVVGVIALALPAGLALAAFTSRRLTRPILELVGATEAVGRGELAARVAVRSRDEIGRLGLAFNDMAAGLALKEKYRHVLDRVTDREVAERLLHGELALGGELRSAAVLFCDIRGFTPLTDGMDPQRVVEFLNEHMTALTAVVHRHHGVVDKFVGDALMAVFGAPKSYGSDARDAALCALEFLAERARLDAATGRTVRIGVGVATGVVLAGCMGSAARLNYTVLGDRVNLAARLCSRAAAGEVLVDEATRAAAGDAVAGEALEPVALKGFAQPVPVFRLARHHDA